MGFRHAITVRFAGSSRGHRLSRGPAAIALLLAALLLPPAATPVAAAGDLLDVRTVATYTLRPDDRLVHVRVDVTATNRKPSSGLYYYYYEAAGFAIQEEATHVTAARGGTKLRTKTTGREHRIELEVRFGFQLLYGRTVSFRFEYDLPGAAPRSTEGIRAGPAFAAFYAWSFGDRGDVRIVLPAGFEETLTGSPMKRSVDEGQVVLMATGIKAEANWLVFVIAERAEALERERLSVTVHGKKETVVVAAWPEDPAWTNLVSRLLTRGLPVLGELIGLDWPVAGDLEVSEVYTPLLEGYAGFYLEETDEIRVSEELDDLVIVHEASHAWFNGGLFRERWITEGLADEYASRVLVELGLPAEAPQAVRPTDEVAFPLRWWTHPGRIDDEETRAREEYGYNASWTLLRELMRSAGEAGLREVFAAADANEIAYLGAVAPEKVSSVDDWRRFLDLLEERTPVKDATAHLERWVVPDQHERLAGRADARTRYAALVREGDGWLPPYTVRYPMEVWNFETAKEAMDEARRLLERRDEVESTAARLRLDPPDTLEPAYEAAKDGLEGAFAIADGQLAAMAEIEEAQGAVGAPRDLFVSVGLYDQDPEAALAAAEEAFEADRMSDAATRSDKAVALIEGAAAVGRQRVIVGALAALDAAGGLVLVLLLVRRRRRRRTRVSLAAVGASVVEAAAPPATLAPEGGSDAGPPDPAPARTAPEEEDPLAP